MRILFWFIATTLIVLALLAAIAIKVVVGWNVWLCAFAVWLSFGKFCLEVWRETHHAPRTP